MTQSPHSLASSGRSGRRDGLTCQDLHKAVCSAGRLPCCLLSVLPGLDRSGGTLGEVLRNGSSAGAYDTTRTEGTVRNGNGRKPSRYRTGLAQLAPPRNSRERRGIRMSLSVQGGFPFSRQDQINRAASKSQKNNSAVGATERLLPGTGRNGSAVIGRPARNDADSWSTTLRTRDGRPSTPRRLRHAEGEGHAAKVAALRQA